MTERANALRSSPPVKGKPDQQTNTSAQQQLKEQQKQYVVEYPVKMIRSRHEPNMLAHLARFFASLVLNFACMLPLVLALVLIAPVRIALRLLFKLLHAFHLIHVYPPAAPTAAVASTEAAATSASALGQQQMPAPEFLSPIELFWLCNANVNCHDDDTQNNNPKQQQQQQQPVKTTTAAKKKSDAEHSSQTATAAAATTGIAGEAAAVNGGHRSTAACLFFIDGHLPIGKLRELLKSRILKSTSSSSNGGGTDTSNANTNTNSSSSSSSSSSNKFERFTQYVHDMQAFGYVWLTCARDSFNIDEHTIECERTLRTDDELQAYVSSLLSTHTFERQRPLWRLYHVRGFGADRSTTVCVFLYHMCFANGVTLMRLFFKCLIDNRTELDVKPRHAHATFYLDLLKQLVFGWTRLFAQLIGAAGGGTMRITRCGGGGGRGAARDDHNPLHARHYRSKAFANLRLTRSPSSSSSSSLAAAAAVATESTKNIVVVDDETKEASVAVAAAAAAAATGSVHLK